MNPTFAAGTAKRILILKPSSLGDIVHALPVLAALRRANPDAHIAWLCGTAFVDLLRGIPAIDEVIPFERRRFGAWWWKPSAATAFWSFIAGLRRRRFDVVLDLQGLLRSALIGRLAGGQQIGFADAREGAAWLYSQRIRTRPDSRHAVEKLIDFSRAISAPLEKPEFDLHLTAAEREDARGLTRAGAESPGGYVAIAPGARWPSKLWSPASFADLVRSLAARGQCCVLVGAPDERPLADQIRERCDAFVDLVGRTSLRQLAAVLANADAVICLDSGPMHLAAALNRPTVAIFGPTDPALTGPYSAAATVVTNPLPCMPCRKRVCPLIHHDCMAGLAVEKVLSALDRLPGRNSRASTGGGQELPIVENRD